MTPKKKSEELFNKMFCSSRSIEVEQAKKCALIAVDEMLDDDMYGMDEEHFEKRINYLEEVKQEIQLL
jgi:hypothetical protein